MSLISFVGRGRRPLFLLAVLLCCSTVSEAKNLKKEIVCKPKIGSAQETDVIDLIEDISCALYDFKDDIDNIHKKTNENLLTISDAYIGAILGKALDEVGNPNGTFSKQIYKVAFSAYTQQAILEDSVVTYTDYNSDYRNSVDLEKGVFTVQKSGTYLIIFQVFSTNNSQTRSNNVVVQLRVNGITQLASHASSDKGYIVYISTVLHLDRGDRVFFFVSGGPLISQHEIAKHITHFSGVQLG